jgi:hypothetical protein
MQYHDDGLSNIEGLAFCPNQMGGNEGSLNEERWFDAPTGRKGIAQERVETLVDSSVIAVLRQMLRSTLRLY